MAISESAQGLSTAMGAAFAKAGVNSNDATFLIAIARYLNAGGTIERARALIDQASSKLPGGSHKKCDAQSLVASARQPNGEGPGRVARDAQTSNAGASPTSRDGAGQFADADQEKLARSDREPLMPPRPPRGLSAILSVQPTVNSGLMRTTRASDGRAWADIGFHELDGMDRDGHLARLIKRRVGVPADRFAKLEALITETVFSEVMHEARTQNDAS